MTRPAAVGRAPAGWLPVVAILAGALFAALLIRLHDDAGADTLPPFSLPDLYRPDAWVRTADLEAAPVLVNVWATWCVPCRQEHSQLLRIADSGEVAIIGIAWRDRRDHALRWLAFLGDPYTRVGTDEDGAVAARLGVTGAPETLLVAADGRILARHAGPLDDYTWREVLRPLLRRATPPLAGETADAPAPLERAPARPGRG